MNLFEEAFGFGGLLFFIFLSREKGGAGRFPQMSILECGLFGPLWCERHASALKLVCEGFVGGGIRAFLQLSIAGLLQALPDGSQGFGILVEPRFVFWNCADEFHDVFRIAFFGY